MICSICDCEFDLDSEGGVCGEIGILPVQFCPTCYNGIMDMAERMRGDVMKFNATLWTMKKDHEGEITIAFKVPSSDAPAAASIPDGKNLILNVEEGYLDDKK